MGTDPITRSESLATILPNLRELLDRAEARLLEDGQKDLFRRIRKKLEEGGPQAAQDLVQELLQQIASEAKSAVATAELERPGGGF